MVLRFEVQDSREVDQNRPGAGVQGSGKVGTDGMMFDTERQSERVRDRESVRERVRERERET